MVSTVGDSRAKLIDVCANLMWRAGYSATSPRDVVETSGIGQGSLYHHFPTKVDLGIAAIEANSADVVAVAERALVGPEPGVVRLRRYLLGRRNGLAGCKIGGLAYDPGVIDDARLREPVDRAFRRIIELVEGAIRDAQGAGDVRATIPAGDLAAMVFSLVQGGFVLARAQHDQAVMRRACGAAFALLDARVADK